MRKIPTIFARDWDGDRSRVLDEVVPGCEWVFAGEGVPTRKYDGTACAVIDGTLFKRHAIRCGNVSRTLGEVVGTFASADAVTVPLPPGFVPLEVEDGRDHVKLIGWLPVGHGSEDRWHREALERMHGLPLEDGTYELVGPKIQGNPEGFDTHRLVCHADAEKIGGIVLTFDGIREVLALHNVEGIVWHHPDGRMAKIKKRDFGLRRS